VEDAVRRHSWQRGVLTEGGGKCERPEYLRRMTAEPSTRSTPDLSEFARARGVGVVMPADGGVGVVLPVDGDVDVATAPLLRQRLDSLLDNGRSEVVVDLSAVGFLDSSGLGALVWGLKKAKARGGWVRLVVVEPRVHRMFELTGLDRSFQIFDTISLAQAVGSRTGG